MQAPFFCLANITAGVIKEWGLDNLRIWDSD